MDACTVHFEVTPTRFVYRLGAGCEVEMDRGGRGVQVRVSSPAGECLAAWLGPTVVGALAEWLDGRARNILIDQRIDPGAGDVGDDEERGPTAGQLGVGDLPQSRASGTKSQVTHQRHRSSGSQKQAVAQAAAEFFAAHPKATWRACWRTVPNHYASETVMQASMPRGLRKGVRR